jgi:hypothetical protein
MLIRGRMRKTRHWRQRALPQFQIGMRTALQKSMLDSCVAGGPEKPAADVS